MSEALKNVIVGVLAVLITGLILWGAYSVLSELGFTTDNQINFNRTLKVTFQNSNEFDLSESGSQVAFSIVNNGTLDMTYDVLIKTEGLLDSEVRDVVISLDDYEYRLTDLEKFNEYYILYSGTIRKEDSSNDVVSHRLVTVSDNSSGRAEVYIRSSVSNDLATEVIAALNYDDNRFGLDTDTFNNVRYVGSNPYNYIKFNNELWRIIGVFNVVDSMDNMEGLRVKIVRDETLESQIWSNDANLFNNSRLAKYLNDEYYLNIEDSRFIDVATYKIGEYGAITSKEHALRLESSGATGASVVSIPSIADYLYASEWMDNGIWLLASNEASTDKCYKVFSTGEVGLGEYHERALVSPVVYLKSTVRIVSGDGSLTNPFEIE